MGKLVMDIERIENQFIYSKLNEVELIILNNALNEICNNLDDSEFSARIGVDREKAEKLLDEFNQLVDRLNKLC
jgi:hypothetical protein